MRSMPGGLCANPSRVADAADLDATERWPALGRRQADSMNAVDRASSIYFDRSVLSRDLPGKSASYHDFD